MFKALGIMRNVSPSQITYWCSNSCSNGLLNQKHNFSIGVYKLEKWDLMSAVSLERKPIITKDLHEMENKFMNVLRELEYERSSKSDHEIRKEKDKFRSEQIKKGKLSDIDSELVTQQTAQDLEDAYKDELKAFKLSERLTEADSKNDVKSIHRKLDQSLLLLVQQKIGNDLYWVLPQGINKEGETMRQTAERVLRECCGNSLKTRFFGNAPCGVYKYKYPHSVLKEGSSVGAKIFFFKAQFLDGTPNKGQIADYQWAARNELPTVLQKEYMKSVSLFLVDDEN